MKIFDKLKTVFEGRFEDILANNNIKLFDFSRNTTNVLELKEGERLSLDVSKGTEEDKKKAKEIIDFIVQEEKDAFFTNNSSEKTQQIKRNLPLKSDEELLKFYKDKLNPDMLKAVEGSLVVKNAWARREDISDLKRDISCKYPDFGNNICNLVTGGYFENYFKELYENMLEQEDFNILNYQQEVERIIRSLPYMVFINRYKSYEEFSGEVKFKLGKLKKYGTEKFKLHGLGRDNVEKALKIIEEYDGDKSVFIEKYINPSGTIITAIFRLQKTTQLQQKNKTLDYLT